MKITDQFQKQMHKRLISDGGVRETEDILGRVVVGVSMLLIVLLIFLGIMAIIT